MNRAFLEAYNRELALLYERSKEFAEDYPGIAERLGGLTRNNLDPAVAGLLEGAAFMAARVQLKIDSEFETFTNEILERLLPNFLAPTPSVVLVQAEPAFDNEALLKGQHFPAGAYLDARYVDRDQRISCRFRLSAPLSIWPLRLDHAAMVNGPGAFQALGLEVLPQTAGGLHLTLACPAPDDPEGAVSPMSGLRLDRLPLHISGDLAESVAIYEQMFCATRRITLRYLDARGDPVFIPVPPEALEQIGFEDGEAIFAEDTAVFRGFTLLREFFMFPQKFLGFALNGLRPLLARVPAGRVDLLFEMDSMRPSLPPRVGAGHFRLFAAPAVNLFEENSSQVRLDARRHEYIVTPDSSPASHYEVHRVTDVFAYYQGIQNKVPVHPLYALPAEATDPRSALFFTTRTRPRRLTAKERRFGRTEGYRGTETLISIYEPGGLDSTDRVQRLQVRTLCSNRHLPAYLPLAQSEADFRLNDDATVSLRCIAGPTPPRESVLARAAEAPHRATVGPVPWRLIAYLSLNALGIDDRGTNGDGGAGLREILTLFSDVTSATTERHIRGLRAVTSRPVTRSIRRGGAFLAARGIEITLRLDERAFEGSGIMLIGAVLDRFLAEYASVNSFTQVVVESEQRGRVKVWPPRTGQGPLL